MNWDMVVKDPLQLAKALRQIEQDISRIQKNTAFSTLEVGGNVFTEDPGDVSLAGDLAVGGSQSLSGTLIAGGDIQAFGALNAPHLKGWDGWIEEPYYPWAANSPNGIMVTNYGDLSALFPVGCKLRLKQGGAYKYFYVWRTAYAAPNFFVDIIPTTSYSIAATAVTNVAYGYTASPQGFPQWLSWTPTVTPSSGAITSYVINLAQFQVVGRQIRYQTFINITNNGTGAGTVNVTLPVSAGVVIGYGRENVTTGKMLQIIGTGTSMSIFTYDNLYPCGTNSVMLTEAQTYL